jgi:hypothetical protein
MPHTMQQNPRARKFKLGKIEKYLLAQIPCRTGLGQASSGTQNVNEQFNNPAP